MTGLLAAELAAKFHEEKLYSFRHETGPSPWARISLLPGLYWEPVPCPNPRCLPVISEQGFVDFNGPPEPEAGTFRITFLGDSVTYGGWISSDFKYPRIIERRLNQEFGPAMGVRFETVNTAVPGYNIEQIAAVYRHKARALRSHLVVYAFNSNDLTRSRITRRPNGDLIIVSFNGIQSLENPFGIGEGLHQELDAYSSLYRLFVFHLMLNKAARGLGEAAAKSDWDNEFSRLELRHLDTLAEDAREARQPLVFAGLPATRCAGVNWTAVRPGSPKIEYDCRFHAGTVRMAARKAAALETPVWNLENAYAGRQADEIVVHASYDRDHPNDLGNELLVNEYMKYLRAWLCQESPLRDRAARVPACTTALTAAGR
ncbi:MAG: hypothetical protein GMKNLPBB_02899 [Myxococcota bacterium]|nr:hypothetical protein [Myxococcota bacterium]